MSAPNVLTVATQGNEQAVLFMSHPMGSSGARCELSVRVDQRGQFQTDLVVLNLQAGSPAYYRIQLNASPDSIQEYAVAPDGSVPANAAAGVTLKDGMWHRVLLEAAVGDGGHLTLRLDGTDVGYASQANLSVLPVPTSITLQLGSASFGGDGGWRVAYDDVVCDLLP